MLFTNNLLDFRFFLAFDKATGKTDNWLKHDDNNLDKVCILCYNQWQSDFRVLGCKSADLGCRHALIRVEEFRNFLTVMKHILTLACIRVLTNVPKKCEANHVKASTRLILRGDFLGFYSIFRADSGNSKLEGSF